MPHEAETSPPPTTLDYAVPARKRMSPAIATFWVTFYVLGAFLVILTFQRDIFVRVYWTMIQSSCLAWTAAMTLCTVRHRLAYAAASVAIAIFWVQLCFQVVLWVAQFLSKGDFLIVLVLGQVALVFIPLTVLVGIVLRYRLWRGVPGGVA